MRQFSYQPPAQRIVFGADAARRDLATEVDRLGLRRLLLVTTPGERTRIRDLIMLVAERIAGEFTATRRHVPVAIAEAARSQASSIAADGLLSIGGGSTTGTAKAVALELGLPIVAVPTTYAGSEVTPIWGLTTGRRKTTGRSPAVLPRTVVYDPELTLSLPPEITGPSGMNALAHAVEALADPDTDPVTALLAVEGIRVLATALPAAVNNGADLEARGEVLYGAYLAATAFAATGSGLHHKICHLLGGAYDLPHAETHTVLLPAVTRFLEQVAPQPMTRVAQALGAESPAIAVYDLAKRIKAPAALADIGMAEPDLDSAVDLVAEHAGLNPTSARRILTAAFNGEHPQAHCDLG